MPNKVAIQELEDDRLARTDIQNPFEVRSDQTWEAVEANIFKWLPELAEFLLGREKDRNPKYQAGEIPEQQQLPHFVLCSKDRTELSVVSGVEFPTGEQVKHFSENLQKTGIANTTIIFGMFTSCFAW